LTQPAPAAIYVAVSADDDAPDAEPAGPQKPASRGAGWRWPGLTLAGIGAPAALWMVLSLAVSLAALGLAVAALARPRLGPGWALLPLVGCAALAVAVLALSRRGARAMRERDDRIHALVAERDAALRADQEKSRFLTIASHDLRQPVHALGLFAATLDKRLQGSPDEHLVRNMIRSIDGLDRSFNAMLDISRLDAGSIEPNIQHFPLRDLFRRLHMHFAGQAELRGLGLRFSPGGKAVSSDPQLLERILGNLVQNAIKYTEQGGIVVVARTTRTRINVEVWDTGIGIGAAELPRVFDEFYQVGRGERARSRGLGMGLAIVKRLARLLGHELTVVSRAGKGTLFRIGIALSDLPEIQDATAAADTLPMPLAQSRTILIIDDGEAIREGLRLLLEEWGYDAIAAGSIAEAERAVFALDAPPDLILSDLHLGDGPDGLAAIDAIRRQCGHDVPAIVITGDTSHGEMRRVSESGHPVLFKPVQPRKLYNVLRGLLT
jgi:two-component system, sensor histidine kinase